MFRAFLLCCLVTSALAFRERRDERDAPRQWRSTADRNNGPCGAHMKLSLDIPISLPLLCSGEARNLRIDATARGRRLSRFRIYINDGKKGEYKFPTFASTRTHTVKHGSLSKGLHFVKFTGDGTDLHKVLLTGDGASCSFTDAPGFSMHSWTNAGIDNILNVFNSSRDRSKFQRDMRKLHFVFETFGRTEDNSISAKTVEDGTWEWFYRYSQHQVPTDKWMDKHTIAGAMFPEAYLKPYPTLSLKGLPGGPYRKDMVVLEPCNTVSNLYFNEAAAWTTCKNSRIPREQHATVIAAMTSLGAGSGFFHGSGTFTGQLLDRYGMQVVTYQLYQIMATKIIKEARNALNAEERDAIMNLNSNTSALDAGRELTSLLRTPYDPVAWNKTGDAQARKLPKYELGIVGIVVLIKEALHGKILLPGINAVADAILDELRDGSSDGKRDVEFARAKLIPAVKKAFGRVEVCDQVRTITSGFLKFIVTFVDAAIWQSKDIQVPKAIRNIVGLIDKLGFSSDQLSEMVVDWDHYSGKRDYCKKRSVHSQWHEKCAHGLVHVFNVVNMYIGQVKDKC